MFFLIKYPDNPFDYVANGEKGTCIPLKPLHGLLIELDEYVDVAVYQAHSTI